jgi:hypothetical protein
MMYQKYRQRLLDELSFGSWHTPAARDINSLKMGEPMKLLRLKATLLSEDDGNSWLVVRQFYCCDLQTNQIIPGIELAGMKLKTLSKPENLNDRIDTDTPASRG